MKTHRKHLLTVALIALPAVLALAAFMPSAHGADAAAGPIKHIVLLSIKDDATPEQLKGLADATKKLKADVSQIQTIELGTNLASNTRNEGYTKCLYVTFKTEADLKTYIDSPGHQDYKKTLLPLVKKVLVFDYTAEN